MVILISGFQATVRCCLSADGGKPPTVSERALRGHQGDFFLRLVSVLQPRQSVLQQRRGQHGKTTAATSLKAGDLTPVWKMADAHDVP